MLPFTDSPFVWKLAPALLGAAGGSHSTERLDAFRDELYPAVVESVRYLGPEILVLFAAIVVLVTDFFLPRRQSKHLAWVAILGLVLPLFSLGGGAVASKSLFLGMIATDPFATFFKGFFLLGTVPVILLSFGSRSLDGRRMGEFYFLVLTAVFGAMLMASSTHFLMMFLSLEILSISSYVLVGYLRRDRQGSEAALKYIVYGGVASAIMAFGFSLWFGITGSAEIGASAEVLFSPADGVLSRGAAGQILLLLAFLLIFVGLAYKMATVPMHFWAPDVYQGAPTAVTAFLSVVSKAAGFALALRFVGGLAVSSASLGDESSWKAFWESSGEWSLVIGLIAALTMTLGNFAALWQTNLKRLMAYSSIAHAGYLLMALTLLRPVRAATGIETGLQTVAFYLVAYLTMNLGVFAVLVLVESRTGSVELDEYRGLGRRAPLLAVAFVVFLFSLIGIPPTAGFMGKFQLFLGVIGLGSALRAAGDPYWWQYYALVFVAVVNTAVSAYYYLRIVKTMFFEGAETDGASSRMLFGQAERRDPRVVAGGLVVVAMLILTFYVCLRAENVLKTTLNLWIQL